MDKKELGKIVAFIAVVALLVLGGLYLLQRDSGEVDEKPVIYLYSEEETEVTVRLDLDGELTAAWPAYEDGWRVTARPDGTLYDGAGNEYGYLFWEGISDTDWDFSQGFCVAGKDTGTFLREVLAEMGLTPREYNDFITYWMPRMQENAYDLIAFQGAAYEESARLEIDPAPDSVLRVFMAWWPLERPVEIEPQTFTPFVREGFTVVEWGGAQAG